MRPTRLFSAQNVLEHARQREPDYVDGIGYTSRLHQKADHQLVSRVQAARVKRMPLHKKRW